MGREVPMEPMVKLFLPPGTLPPCARSPGEDKDFITQPQLGTNWFWMGTTRSDRHFHLRSGKKLGLQFRQPRFS